MSVNHKSNDSRYAANDNAADKLRDIHSRYTSSHSATMEFSIRFASSFGSESLPSG